MPIWTLLMMLVGFSGCRGGSAPQPPKPIPEIRYLPSPSEKCVRKRAPKSCTEPGLMICSNPNDMTPGSCARINNARVIDAYGACLTWAGLVAVLCEVP